MLYSISDKILVTKGSQVAEFDTPIVYNQSLNPKLIISCRIFFDAMTRYSGIFARSRGSTVSFLGRRRGKRRARRRKTSHEMGFLHDMPYPDLILVILHTRK